MAGISTTAPATTFPSQLRPLLSRHRISSQQLPLTSRITFQPIHESPSLSLPPPALLPPTPPSSAVYKRRRCARDAAAATDSSDLEAEVYEFMLRSPNPNRFPTRAELLEAGRGDLAASIARHGGWLALGWNLDSNDDDDCERDGEEDRRDSQKRSFDDGVNGSLTEDDPHYVSPPSFSGRSMEMETGNCMGIEGILTQLEKERNLALSIDSLEKQVNGRRSWNIRNDPGDTYSTSNNRVSIALKSTHGHTKGRMSKSSDPARRSIDNSATKYSQNSKPADINGREILVSDTWRSWSMQRSGYSEFDFEAAEIVPTGDKRSFQSDTPAMDQLEKPIQDSDEGADKLHSGAPMNSEKQLHMRLRLLESEVKDSPADELQRLSDTWEFLETEEMKARDRLRSLRAKLAVLEGKMALERIEAQKIIEDKKGRLSAAHRALQNLRTVYVVWPNSASQVLLAGSFDGWTTQRKMERSRSGVFSLYLKLYPGNYEIKFVVDGVWTIDPLRPIVRNHGYENNLLTVT